MNELQNEILKIYKVVKNLCENNGIKYWAIGGTAIGAVRHNGFIPWDDDLDIAMSDEDYKKFLEIAPKELPEPYELITESQFPHSSCMFLKVHNTETAFIESSEAKYPDSYKGIYIDIFLMRGLPDGRIKRRLNAIKSVMIVKLNRMMKWTKEDYASGVAKVLWTVLRPVKRVLPESYWLNAWKKTVYKYRFMNSEYTMIAGTGIFPGQLYKREWFGETVDLKFEDTVMPVPERYDEILTTAFGDYMTMPPEDQRKAKHGGGIIDLNKSYKLYAKEQQEKK